MLSCVLFCFFFPPAPDSTSGVISKTVEICLHKEGNSFGFVMRGKYIISAKSCKHLLREKTMVIILVRLFICVLLINGIKGQCLKQFLYFFLCYLRRFS